MKSPKTLGEARHIADRRILLRNVDPDPKPGSTTWQVRVLDRDYHTVRGIPFEGTLADAVECCTNMRTGFARALV